MQPSQESDALKKGGSDVQFWQPNWSVRGNRSEGQVDILKGCWNELRLCADEKCRPAHAQEVKYLLRYLLK